MVRLNYIFSGLLLVVTLVICFNAAFTWKRRKMKGGLPFFFICISIASYTLGYAMDLISSTLENIDVWSKFQYLGLATMPSLWIALGHEMTGKDKKMNLTAKLMLILMPSLTFLFRLTNERHELMYVNQKVISNGYFNVISFDRGIWYNIHYSFFIICALISLIMYYRAAVHSNGYTKKQMIILFFASLIPLLGMIWNVVGNVPLQLDGGSYAAVMVYLCFAYAIFRYDMMCLIPLSREKIFDCIYDGAIVVDSNYMLRDFNVAATKIFQFLDRTYVGRKLELCTIECPEFSGLLTCWCESNLKKTKKAERQEVFEFQVSSILGEVYYYKARPMALYDKESIIGTTILITDITDEKEMLLELERRARIDEVTGILNRRYFIELANMEFGKLIQQSENGIMVMFDIDHFKQINDSYGHQAGDFILKELADITAGIIRNNDLLGRYGGEEYIIFLPGLTVDNGKLVVERIRAAFEQHTFLFEQKAIQVTASFGITQYYKLEDNCYCSFDEMIKKVDRGLYQAKKNGRNQIVVC